MSKVWVVYPEVRAGDIDLKVFQREDDADDYADDLQQKHGLERGDIIVSEQEID